MEEAKWWLSVPGSSHDGRQRPAVRLDLNADENQGSIKDQSSEGLANDVLDLLV